MPCGRSRRQAAGLRAYYEGTDPGGNPAGILTFADAREVDPLWLSPTTGWRSYGTIAGTTDSYSDRDSWTYAYTQDHAPR